MGRLLYWAGLIDGFIGIGIYTFTDDYARSAATMGMAIFLLLIYCIEGRR